MEELFQIQRSGMSSGESDLQTATWGTTRSQPHEGQEGENLGRGEGRWEMGGIFINSKEDSGVVAVTEEFGEFAGDRHFRACR